MFTLYKAGHVVKGGFATPEGARALLDRIASRLSAPGRAIILPLFTIEGDDGTVTQPYAGQIPGPEPAPVPEPPPDDSPPDAPPAPEEHHE